jgi:lipopolysaccharide biosynthesis glycosyltransferase
MIELACTTDGAYAPHTGTLLHSVFSASPTKRFRVHVLTSGLSAPDRQGLEQVAASFGATVHFLPISETQSAAFPNRKFHRSCWYRMLLPELLPSMQRVLYLDSDMIVRESVDEIWRADLGNRPIAAVINPFYPFFPDYHVSHLGLAPGSPYYNSGVLVMDLDRMRRAGFCDQVRAYAREHPDNLYPEQDALNALYQHEVLALHPRWNAQSTMFELDADELPFPTEQVADVRTNPAIVHYIGPYKPWRYLCTHPLRHLYLEHRSQTPWPLEAFPDRTLRSWLLRRLPIGWRYRWTVLEGALRRALRGAKRSSLLPLP